MAETPEANTAHQPAVDFIGVGAARCGTSWLHEALDAHPDVFVPKGKELHFFDRDEQFALGTDHYEAYFREKGARIAGEISPRYMLYPACLQRIVAYHPGVKIIVVLRDPVERAVSQYKYFLRPQNKENITNIHRAFDVSYRDDYIKKSLYYKQLKLMFDLFPKQNIHIVSFERLFGGDGAELAGISDFLGIAPITFSPETKVNTSQPRRLRRGPAVIKKYASACRTVAGIEECAVAVQSPVHHALLRLGARHRGSLMRAFQLLSHVWPQNEVAPKVTADDKRALFEAHFAEDVRKCDALVGDIVKDWPTARR